MSKEKKENIYTDNQQSTPTASTVSPYNNSLTIEHNNISLLALINTVYPPLQCIQCNTVSPTHQEEQNHFLIHPPRFNCLHPHCELSFRTKSALRFHISRLHLVKQKPINMITPSYSSVRTTAIPFNNKNKRINNAFTIVTSIKSVPTKPIGTSPSTPPAPVTTVATTPLATTTTTTTAEPTIVESDASTPSPVQTDAPSPASLPSPVIIKKQPSTSPSISPVLSPLSSTSTSYNHQHHHNHHQEQHPEQHQQEQQQASSPSSSTSSLSQPPSKKKSPVQQKQKQKKPTVSSPTNTSVPSWRVSSFGRPTAASRAPRGSKKIILSSETETLLNSIYNPLQCPSCHQRFKRKTNVIKHLTDQHYGEEPYRCIFTDCVHPKLYATREGLVYHILRVHDQPTTPPPISSAPSSPPTQEPSFDIDNNMDHTITKKNNIRPANNNKIQNSTKRRRVDR
ncbi:hypothetical protein BDC45DRAFT_531916 [Circinella umbellata]|nr:hypothetical protein BDC45DRAFT_531916 [Circinella umbellata]